jgi:hypothetical protein
MKYLMQKLLIIHGATTPSSNQKGFVLITGVLVLLLLSLMGLWALSTSDFGVKLSANLQQMNNNFSTAEGAAKREGAGVGFARPGASEWYQISDPDTFNQFLLPPAGSYDPGHDIEIGGNFPDDFDQADSKTWPRQNLLRNVADSTHDYAYLVTYLYPDAPPKGYDAGKFSGYKFKINGKRKSIVEIGGIKVGVKSNG